MATARPSLKWSLLTKMLLLAVLPVAIGAALGIAGLYYLASTDIERGVQAVAARDAAEIDARVDQARYSIAQLAQLQPILRPDEVAGVGKIAVGENSVLQAICVLDKEYVVRAVSLPQGLDTRRSELVGLDLSQLVAQVSSDGNDAHMNPSTWRSPLSGEPIHVVVVVPPGKAGAVLGMIDPAVLYRFIGSPETTGGFAAILAPDGQVIHGEGAHALRAAELAENGKLLHDHVTKKTWDGATYVVATSHSESTPWHIVVGSDRAIIGSEYGAAVWRTIPAASLLALVAAAGAVWLSHRHASPITRLASDVRDAQRSGDHQVSGDAFVETELIASSVRQMALELREREHRLQRLGSTIEAAARGADKAIGQSYLAGLVSELLLATKARCIIAAEWIPGPKPRARIIASRTSVALQDDFSYELSSHPSRRVSDRELLHIRTGVARQYPESPLLRLTGADGYIAIPLILSDGSVGGHIEIIDDHEIVLEDDLRNLLLLLATRGSAELQRMRAERHLQRSESLYAMVTLDQEEIVVRWVIDGTISFVNDAFCRFVRKERAELIGRSLYALLPEEDRERFRDRALELTSLAPTCRFEQQFHDGESGVHWFDWHHRAIPDAKGRVMEYQGTGRAITKLKQLTEDLQRSRTIFAVLAENVESAFWLTDPATQKCLYVNPRFLQVWGIADQRMTEVPMAWTVAIHESQRANVVRNYLLHATDGQYSETYQIVRPDGSLRRIRDRAVPVTGSDGRVSLIVHVAVESAPTAALRPITI